MIREHLQSLVSDPESLDVVCNRCRRRLANIFYSFGRTGYLPFCEDCCEHLALGMLRDFAECQYGKEKAERWYKNLMLLKSIKSQKARELLRDSLSDAIAAEIDSGATPKQAKHNLPERATSTAQLHAQIAKAVGVTVDELAARMNLKTVTLEGRSVQVISIDRK